MRLTPNTIFTFMIAVWSAIFIGFWSIIYIGGNAIVWIVETIFSLPGDQADTFIALLQNVGTIGLLLIWGMGAAMLFIIRRWLTGIMHGPGRPDDIELDHEGKTIETSYEDVTHKR